jgi:hypothetical protein
MGRPAHHFRARPVVCPAMRSHFVARDGQAPSAHVTHRTSEKKSSVVLLDDFSIWREGGWQVPAPIPDDSMFSVRPGG